MPTKAEIINQIETEIIPNLMELITGGILQNNLLGMVHQINDLVGELEDLDTEDVTSIVNAINSLKLRIDGIEDDLTPWVFYGGDDPNITMPTGFGGEIPSFYVQQEHVGLGVVNVGLWTYTGIVGNEWINLVSTGGGADYSNLSNNRIPRYDASEVTLKNSNLEHISTGVKVNGGIELTDFSATPVNGQIYRTGDTLYFKDNSGKVHILNTYEIVIPISPLNEDGVVGDCQPIPLTFGFELYTFKASAYPFPTGADAKIGIKKNGTDITPSVRATIPAGTNNSNSSTPPTLTATTFAVGDVLTPYISQVGSTIKGQNYYITLIIRKV